MRNLKAGGGFAALFLAWALSGGLPSCGSSTTPDGAAADAFPDADAETDTLLPEDSPDGADVEAPADSDAEPCNVSGNWTGTRSVSSTITAPILFDLTQMSGKLTGRDERSAVVVGTITGASVTLTAGNASPADTTTRYYAGTVLASCERIIGDWHDLGGPKHSFAVRRPPPPP